VLLGFGLGATDRNCTLLLYWRQKNWFQLAREIGRSVLQVSVKLLPSLNILISLCICSAHRWLLYVWFVVQPHSGHTIRTFLHIATKPVLVTDFRTKRG